MAKFMKTNGSPTVYSLRRALGMKSKQASGFNSCVGARLKGNRYPKPAPGTGGWKNQQVRDAFTSAVRGCSGRGRGSGRSYQEYMALAG